MEWYFVVDRIMRLEIWLINWIECKYKYNWWLMSITQTQDNVMSSYEIFIWENKLMIKLISGTKITCKKDFLKEEIILIERKTIREWLHQVS